MTETHASPFEQNIAEQPDALDAFAASPLPPALATLDLARFDRIILTGMGASLYAMIPFELQLARRALPVWRIQTSELLDTPERIKGRTLLWITSQSGRSGEVVSLLGRLPPGQRRDMVVVGTTNDETSPLARGADHVVLLRCGDEATVSSKSYLNTLAAFARVGTLLEGGVEAASINDIRHVAASLRDRLRSAAEVTTALAGRALAGPSPRLALIGGGPDAATVLNGALILKEAAKVAAQGYVGGEFRHGPLELAGPGLTALLFGTSPDVDPTLRQLARDLSGTGSLVAAVSPTPFEGAEHIAIPGGTSLERLSHAMLVVQGLSVGLARATGRVPGKFDYGQKVTAQL